MPRDTKISVPGYEPPVYKLPDTEPGWSPLAVPTRKTFTGILRPKGWRGRVYGLVVHTTGSGLPTKAKQRGVSPLKVAVDYYTQKQVRGCHYVIVPEGEIFQLACEDEQAYGVGTGEQRDSILKGKGKWEKDLPAALVQRWKQRWPGYANPLDLLPGTKSANGCYVHVELPPIIDKSRWWSLGGTTACRFTVEQHQAVAQLACDIASRNDWKDAWWRTPQLLGHEDLTPISRSVKSGGWDPGWLRATPYIDWDYIIGDIEVRRCLPFEDRLDEDIKLPKTRKGGRYKNY